MNLSPTGEGFRGFGALGLSLRSADEAPSIFANFISSAIGLVTLIAIIWFLFTFATGAVSIVTGAGDKNAMESAKKKIFSGVVGLAVSVLGLVIARLIGSLIGIDVLDFGTMFSKLIIN